MEVIVGKLAGFCGGVINSVSKTEKILERVNNIYCLGELVHNKQVVDKLESKGMVTIDSLESIPNNSSVIIRAHGVAKEVYELAKLKNIEIYDLTCPNVLKIHEKADELALSNHYIILIAQKDHPEAIGTISFCGDKCSILENIEQLDSIVDDIKKSQLKKVAIISQTTFSVLKFDTFVQKIKSLLVDYEIEVHNTICSATDLRQKETADMAQNVDAMIIIGGKNSSNTKKLYDLSLNYCKDTFIIETVNDLNKDFSIYYKVGVMAGASTPKESIIEVIDYLNS